MPGEFDFDYVHCACVHHRRHAPWNDSAHFLPEQHLSAESKQVVQLGMGLIGTMTAPLASARRSHRQRTRSMRKETDWPNCPQTSSCWTLRPSRTTDPSRRMRPMLLASVADMLQHTWPQENPQSGQAAVKVRTEGRYEGLYEKIQGLAPKNDSQRALQAQALKTGADIAQTRWLMFAQKGSSIPTPFLVVMVCWLTLILASFSLFAPPNPTVITTLLVCALAVSSAIFLILELDRPFDGMIQISSEPLRSALEQTGRNHHTASTGVITEMATGYPGYNSLMPKSCGTVGEMLKQNGYNTAWFGKNHNVPDWQSSQAGPFDLWPTSLGFEYFFGFIGGDTDQWHPAVFEGTEPYRSPGARPELSLRRGPGRPRHRVDSPAALARAGQAVLRLLRAGPLPRAASCAQGMDRQVQGPVRPGLGQGARGNARPADCAGRRARRHQADRAAQRNPRVGFADAPTKRSSTPT